MQNAECKMQNYCIGFADYLKLCPKDIPQFCILHFEFCIKNIIYFQGIYNVFPSPESRTDLISVPFSDIFLKLPTTWPTGSMMAKVLG